MGQAFFHAVFIGVFIAFLAIRAFYHRLAMRTRGVVEFREGKLHRGFRAAVGIPFVVVLFTYMVQPRTLAWADVPLPAWAQWIGVVFGIASLPLIWWVQQALGSNFSTTLHVREHHTLVTHGPYRWVRHPMYTVLALHLIAWLLLTKNWFIGVIPLVVFGLIVVARLQREEDAMSEKFGDAYRHYMSRTGRFFPRF